MSDLARSSCSMAGSVRHSDGVLSNAFARSLLPGGQCNARTAGPCPASWRAPCRRSSGRMSSFTHASLCAPALAHRSLHNIIYNINAI